MAAIVNRVRWQRRAFRWTRVFCSHGDCVAEGMRRAYRDQRYWVTCVAVCLPRVLKGIFFVFLFSAHTTKIRVEKTGTREIKRHKSVVINQLPCKHTHTHTHTHTRTHAHAHTHTHTHTHLCTGPGTHCHPESLLLSRSRSRNR